MIHDVYSSIQEDKQSPIYQTHEENLTTLKKLQTFKETIKT